MAGHDIAVIDGLIGRFVLKQPITVYRYIPAEIAARYGKYYRDPAYSSTSCIEDFMKNVYGYAKLIMRIRAGTGSGAYINRFSSYMDKEYEFLVKRNARFEIKSKSAEKGMPVLRMEMTDDK